MTDNPAASQFDKVAALPGSEPDTVHEPGPSDECSQVLLESFLGNPRFTAPANDEATDFDVAPVRQDCRNAKLLSMWIEILIEEELKAK